MDICSIKLHSLIVVLTLSLYLATIISPWHEVNGLAKGVCGKLNFSEPAIASKGQKYHPPGTQYI